MFGRNARQAHRLRACPVCGSRAVSESGVEASESRAWLRLRCGACGTCRRAHLDWWRANVVEAWLERLHRRDRREIADDLRRLRLAGVEPDDFGVPASRPSRFC